MRQPTTPDDPLAGYLQGIDVPALLREISRRGETGRLHVEHGSRSRTLFFEDGSVYFASSTDPNDRLGEHLLRRGRIKVSQLETALAHQESGKRLGALLVEAGVLTEMDLIEAVSDQVASMVTGLLTWSSGAYHFESGPPEPEEIRLNLTTEQLLFRSLREIRSISRMERELGSPRTVYRLAADRKRQLDALGLTEGGRALVERLAEGPSSIDVLCRDVCASNFDTYQTLWVFKLLGIVEPCSRPDGSPHEGTLSDTSLAELLLRLEEERETGVLHLTSGPVERTLHLAAGRCVFATSSDPDDGLIPFLFRRGVISLRDKEQALRRLLTNQRVGTILRGLGAIDDEDLQAMVRQQVSEIVYDTFSWDEAEWVFAPGSLPHAEEITLNSSAGALVAEGIRRVRSWTRLVRGCGGVDNPLCLTPQYLEILDDIEAGVAEWEVVNALKSPQTPRRIFLTCELEDFRVGQILWTLKLLGAITDSPVEVDEIGTEKAVTADDPAAPSEKPEPAAAGAAAEGRAEGEPSRAESDAEEGPDTSAGPTWPHQEEVKDALRSLGESGSVAAAPGKPPPVEEESDGRDGDVEDPDAEDADAEQGQEAPPAVELPAEVEATIHRFNAMHQVVFSTVRSEVGAGAANFVRSCCSDLAREAPDLVDGVQLHDDGSWDLDGLRRVIVDKGIDDPWELYRRVLDREFVALQPHIGEVRAGELRQRILAMAEDGTA